MDLKNRGKASDQAQLKVNLPLALHRELKIRAAKNVRSLSGEVMYLVGRGLLVEQTAERKIIEGTQA